MTKINQALAAMDPAEDAQWTSDGLPKVEIVGALMKEEVTRQQITAAAPTFNREMLQNIYDKKVSPTVMEADPPEAPKVDPVAFVEAKDEVVGMPIARVYDDPKLVERGAAEFSRQYQVLRARKSVIEDRMEEIAGRITMLDRAHVKLTRQGKIEPVKDTGVQDYLAGQRKLREARRKAAQKFIDAGTTAKDVATAMSTKSTIDAALEARKKGPHGSGRPSYPKK